jgi:predicted nucleotidyltransferase
MFIYRKLARMRQVDAGVIAPYGSMASYRKVRKIHRGSLDLETGMRTGYPADMVRGAEVRFADELRRRFRPFCEKHHIRRLEVFGSAARDQAGPGSDVDLLVTLDDSVPISTAALLEMAGEAEELAGAPVDFVLRSSLERSPNRIARDHILTTSVCVYGS